jgi:hypothetical protein
VKTASAPTPPAPATPVVGRASRRVWVVAAVAGAVVLRLPALLAARHLSFDDGVYGASAVAMRSGDMPFRQVFSSQGPLFLPLVWLADLAGLRTLDAPRLLALAAGAGLVAATWAAARLLSLSIGRALLATGLVATSGSVLWVTGPLTSDGPALALATAAVALALAYRRSPSARLALAAGLCLGASLSVKSLLAGAAVPVGLALLPNRRHLGTAVAGAALVGIVTALPWGLGAVWDQAFRYHLEAAGSRTPLANLGKVAATLAGRDLPLLVGAVGVGLAALLLRRPGRPSRTGTGTALVGAWLVATMAILALEHPLWRNHVAHLVPAVALLVAAGANRLPDVRRSLPLALGVGVLLAGIVPSHLLHNAGILLPPAPPQAEAAARRDLASLPADAWAISDEPGLVWRAGRRTPSDLVDTSVLRLDSGRITAGSLARAAAEPQVCGLLVWSPRFGRLVDLPARLDGYRVAARYGGPRALYVKEGCPHLVP